MNKHVCLRCGCSMAGKKKSQKFCSVTCANLSATKTRYCKQCGINPVASRQIDFCGPQCRATHGESFRKYPESVRKEVARMWLAGVSGSKIAESLRLANKHVVHDLRRSMRLPPRGQPVQLSGIVPGRVLSERETYGNEPLPPMHPISWGAIAL